MKKYWVLWVFIFILGGILFWVFLCDVESNGKEYALLEVFAVVLWGVFAILALVLNIAYWAGIARLIGKYTKNAPKWFCYILLVVYAALGIWLECKLCDGGKYIEEQYKEYQFQKKFEYKYHVDF